jgi:hypothetical protein
VISGTHLLFFKVNAFIFLLDHVIYILDDRQNL